MEGQAPARTLSELQAVQRRALDSPAATTPAPHLVETAEEQVLRIHAFGGPGNMAPGPLNASASVETHGKGEPSLGVKVKQQPTQPME